MTETENRLNFWRKVAGSSIAVRHTDTATLAREKIAELESTQKDEKANGSKC